MSKTDKDLIWAVVPASGVGSRMGAELPKQYLPLLGKTILETTLDTLAACPSVSRMVVGISASDLYWPKLAYTHSKLQIVTVGGVERAHTVLNALQAIIQADGIDDWVLVHDAVRPCVCIQDVECLIQTVRKNSRGGLLAVPVSDTMKRADATGVVDETISREGLWRAMTPQMFKVGHLASALQQAIDSGQEATDESSAMERLGVRPQLISCQASNLKITTPDDLALARLILTSQVSTVQ